MSVRLAVRLKVKYGLTDDPDEAKIAAWQHVTAAKIGAGNEAEIAGRAAAFEVFGELDAALYFSEADTIEVLLRRAAQMTSLSVALRIKYRTVSVPTTQQISGWWKRVDQLVADGLSAENAGSIAANEFFDPNPNLILKAEADTIEYLLSRARDEDDGAGSE